MTSTLLVRMLGTALLLALLVGPARGERLVTAGEFVIHFNAVSSLDIPPEVARQRQITRSAQRALVNIAVRRKTEAGDVAVRARVEGVVRNDVGQTQTLWFREVDEAEAIYYLADPRIELESALRFDIEVQPEGSERTTPVRFDQTFFAPR